MADGLHLEDRKIAISR